MNDLIIMCYFQTRRHLNGNARRLLDRQLSLPFNVVLQCNPFHQLHHNIVDPVFVSHIIDIDDIRMRKSGSCLGFFFKLFDKSSVFTEFFL